MAIPSTASSSASAEDLRNGLVFVRTDEDYGVVFEKNPKTLEVDVRDRAAAQALGAEMSAQSRWESTPAAPSPTSSSPTRRRGRPSSTRRFRHPPIRRRRSRDGVKLIAEGLRMTPEKIVSECDLCINGTTVGLNALITHRGGKTGLSAPRRTRGSIEIPQRPQGRRIPLRSRISGGEDACAALSERARASASSPPARFARRCTRTMYAPPARHSGSTASRP